MLVDLGAKSISIFFACGKKSHVLKKYICLSVQLFSMTFPYLFR